MTADTQFRCIILLEPEIRKAAKLLKRAKTMIDASDEDGPVDRAVSLAIWDAMEACCVALLNADSDDAILMLSAHDIDKAVKAKPEPPQ